VCLRFFKKIIPKTFEPHCVSKLLERVAIISKELVVEQSRAGKVIQMNQLDATMIY